MSHAVEKKEASIFWVLLYWVAFPILTAKVSIILLPLIVLFFFIPPKSSPYYTGGDPAKTSKYLAK